MSTDPPPSMRTVRFIWFALMASTLIHVAILVVLSQGWAPDARPDAGQLPLIIAAVGFVEAPLVFVLRRVVMGSVALLPPDPTGTRDVASPAALDAALPAALARYQTGTIVGCALAEAVVLFGFVAAFLSQELAMVGANWVLGVLLMAVQLPRWQGVAHLLEPAERAALYLRHGLGLRA